jgi:hypothetical protein
MTNDILLRLVSAADMDSRVRIKTTLQNARTIRSLMGGRVAEELDPEADLPAAYWYNCTYTPSEIALDLPEDGCFIIN